MTTQLNAILTLRRQIINDDEEPTPIARGLLEQLCDTYNADLTAQQRVDVRRGGTRRPTNVVDVGLLVVDELQGIRKTLDGIHDTMRYAVSSMWLQRCYTHV